MEDHKGAVNNFRFQIVDLISEILAHGRQVKS
jgi:hypothetical protein